MNNALFISSTHGNETFSQSVLRRLKNDYKFDWVIGNPRAAKLNKRYIDSDLNRVAPGNPNSKLYEECRAAYLVNKAKSYQATIDIHGTLSDCDLFVIVSDPSWENIELAKKINLPNILLWPSLKPTGPLTQIIRPGIEIECGPKDDPTIAKKLEEILAQFLEQKPITCKQQFFVVTGKLMGENDPTLKDFRLAKRDQESFYPVLADNRYPGITCYKAQRLSDTL